MVVVNGGKSLKRMKRRVTADLHDFLTFPSTEIAEAESFPGGPFRTNIKSFLSKHALLPPPSALFPHLLTWQILFRVGDQTEGPDSSPAVVCLDVVEEDVARSRSVYCDQCRVVGWSGNPVCGKRYHFIIEADGNSIGGYHKPCMCCGDILHLSESKCKSCNHITTTDDVEDWVYHQLENTSHLLHGLVHSNGHGHLLRVNGREGGSRVLSGVHIMDFWDRLCKFLGVRKVSVMDVSRKYGLEYRLLHAITKGHPWYGDWGYEFGSGSYAVALDAYELAVESLSSLPLSIFLSQGQTPHSPLQDVISYYQSLSENKLMSIRDLFCFLMGLIHESHKTLLSADDSTCKKRRTESSGSMCSWTKSDIERVEEAMLRVLRAVSNSTWVSWRALRGAVCKVAPPDLLDYCLSELGGKVIHGGMVVVSRCNPDSGAFEYRLETVSGAVGRNTGCNGVSSTSSSPSKFTLLQDLRYLYECMLHPQTMLVYDPRGVRDVAINSAEKLLDCKKFVKDYGSEEMLTMTNARVISIPCQVELSDDSEEDAPLPPPELIVLPLEATVSDFKLEVSNAFQDVYLMFRRLHVEEFVNHGGVDDSTQVKLLLIGAEGSVRVRGRCLGKNGLSRFRMERGIERWTVDCECGAKDDDGERMLACDICGVWQHTRCSGIRDTDPVPARFVCPDCRSSDPTPKTSTYCKDETMTNFRGNMYFGKSLPMPSDVR